MPGNTAYCLSKGGMRMLTRMAGLELARHPRHGCRPRRGRDPGALQHRAGRTIGLAQHGRQHVDRLDVGIIVAHRDRLSVHSVRGGVTSLLMQEPGGHCRD